MDVTAQYARIITTEAIEQDIYRQVDELIVSSAEKGYHELRSWIDMADYFKSKDIRDQYDVDAIMAALKIYYTEKGFKVDFSGATKLKLSWGI